MNSETHLVHLVTARTWKTACGWYIISKTFSLSSTAFFNAEARLLVTSTSLTKNVYGVGSLSFFAINALQINCKFSAVIFKGKSIGDSSSSPLSDLNCARTWAISSFSSDSDNFLLETLETRIFNFNWKYCLPTTWSQNITLLDLHC